MQYDYTTVGHVTIDVLDDGSRRPGGTAFYSALQAARLGRRALIITRGDPAELERLLEPYAGELELQVQPAATTTTLRTSGQGEDRRQRVLAWAGPIGEDVRVATSILHVAPVARETPSHWQGAAELVGLTPQGLVRTWDPSAGAEIAQGRPPQGALELASRCEAIVLSEYERASCAELIAAASANGALVAVTAGAHPLTLIVPGSEPLELDVFAHEHPVEDLGAGDVFAAAFFIALHERRPAREAARFAGAAAAVRVAGAGAGAVGNGEQIDARLRLSPYS